MGRFLIFLSGAKPEVLERCPSERTKYVSVGAVVLTTGAFAALAATLLALNIFKLDIGAAMAFGAFWGIVIVNLDRWLVVSAQRQDNFFRSFATLVPRVFLALVLGTVIAEPLVLAVFNDEIETKALEIQQKRESERRAEIEEEFVQLEGLRTRQTELQAVLASPTAGLEFSSAELSRIDEEIASLENDYREAENAVICENEGTCGSGRAGEGPAYRDKLARRDRIANDLERKRGERDALVAAMATEQSGPIADTKQATEKELFSVSTRIEELEQKRDETEQNYNSTSSGEFGLKDRIHALHELSKEDAAVNSALWLLRLFIIMLDTLPVLVKALQFLGKPTLYERELEEFERERYELSRMESRTELERRRLAITVKVNEATVRQKLEQEAAEKLAQEAVEAQLDLARGYLSEWKRRAQEEMQRAIGNPPAATGPPPGDHSGPLHWTAANGWGSGDHHDGAAKPSPRPGPVPTPDGAERARRRSPVQPRRTRS